MSIFTNVFGKSSKMITFSQLGKLGRLGNAMFQIAATIAHARRMNLEACFPPWEYRDVFSIPLPVRRVVGLPRYQEKRFEYDPIPQVDGIDLYGYFQSEKYFSDHQDTIKGWFNFAIGIKTQLSHKYESILKDRVCSVHVRRTDYLNLSQYHPPLGMGYYLSAIEAAGRDMKFLVFSDDIQWCKENPGFKGDNILFVEGNSAAQDMCLMSWCNDHIIANSSFSWWGSWLCEGKDKRVFAPKKSLWFGKEYAHKSVDDLYCENWTIL